MNDQRSTEPGRAYSQDAIEGGAFRPLARGGEAVQQLRQALERVERESVGLIRVASTLEQFVRQQESRYAELEQDLNDTALLYVASYQLHACFEPKEVLRHMRELLEQLAGVEAFALYLGAPGGLAHAVASKGLSEPELTPLRTTEVPLGPAFAGRQPVLLEQSPLPKGSLSTPLAVIPLVLQERVIGAILVLKLLGHKSSWAAVDQQLFQLLSSRAAAALVAAHLMQRQGDVLDALAGLGESLK